MKEFWNERYLNPEFVYGEQPNLFLKEQLEKLPVGRILFPADGEGRNSVYAAGLGWKVSAFDISIEGKNKAMRLAEKNHVEIDYQVGALEDMHFSNNQFDVIALIFAHFSADIKSAYHKTLKQYLRPNGLVIFEAYSKKQIEYNSKNEKAGGPKDIATLFSIEEIRSDFEDFSIIQLEEKEIEINDGAFHNGIGAVIEFIGLKQ